MNKNHYSLLNALSALGMTLTNGLLGIVVTHFVIARFGSDFNGLNSTANQIVNVLLILEGGFTLASNVALFAPLTAMDYRLVNGILSATRKKFRRIGFLFLALGAAVSVGYAFVVNSALPTEFIVTVIMMTVFPAAFNLYYATVYRVLLQTQQKEYIINFITMCTVGLGHAANIVMILLGGPMWMVRFLVMICTLLNSLLIAGYVKRKNAFLDLAETPRPDLIRGTGDVMVQKITGVVYSAAPIIFLSISSAGGTVLASVYAVYNNVFTMIKSLLHAVIDAPRLGFGQMLTERKPDQVWSAFAQYEYLAFVAIFVLLTTANTLILPFVRLYTAGVNDANYNDPIIALLMVWITAFEMIHIPSGHLINMAGKFRASRNIQIIACAVLLIGMSVGGLVFGVYGMLAAILATAVLLAVMEMGYVHVRFFAGSWKQLLWLLLPLVLAGVAVGWLELSLHASINGYISFILYGVLWSIVNAAVALAVGYVFNRAELTALFRRALVLFHWFH